MRDQGATRVFIASDNKQATRQIQELLAHCGMECPAGHTVELESAADRASRIVPELVVLVLPPDLLAGLKRLRETCNTVQNAHILVVGPATDPKLILKALHDGADEYLDSALLASELTDALARFKARKKPSTRTQQPGRVIAVLGPSGGSGSSTLAANLSAVLAKDQGECGLIDLRLAAGDLASMLNLKPPHSIADLCDRLDRLDQGMFEQFFVRHRVGICLLAAPREFRDIKRVTSKGVRRALSMGRVRFPYVVADLDNAFASEQVEALWQSDLILLVLRLDFTSIRNARRAMDQLTDLGIGLDNVALVVSGYRQRRQLRVVQAEQALGMEILHCIPNDPASIHRAINKGTPVVIHRPSAKISKSYTELAAAVNGHYQRSKANRNPTS